MVQLIGKDDILASRKTTHQGEIRCESTAENERRLRPLPFGQRTFESPQWREMPGDQRRRPRPAAMAFRGPRCRASQPRIGGQVEIIVGGKVEILAPVDLNNAAL